MTEIKRQIADASAARKENRLMCVRTTCEQCGKPSYAGCGRHVEQVLRDVPTDQRCRCRDGQAKAAPKPPASGWLKRFFGRDGT